MPRQLGQRRIRPRAGRSDATAATARVLVPQQPQRLPAGPGLARGRPAHQHRDAAAARPPPPAPPVPVPCRARAARTPAAPAAPAGASSGCDRPVHLQRERIAHLPQQPPAPRDRPGPAGRPAGCRPGRRAWPRPGQRTAPGYSRRRSTATTSGSSPGSSLSSNRAGQHVHPGLGHRPGQRGPPLQPGPVPGRVLGRDEHHHRRGLLRVDPRAAPRPGACPTARPAHRRRRSSAPPAPSAPRRPAPRSPAARRRTTAPHPTAAPARRLGLRRRPLPPCTRVCHQPGTGNTAPPPGQDLIRGSPTDSSAACPRWLGQCRAAQLWRGNGRFPYTGMTAPSDLDRSAAGRARVRHLRLAARPSP